MSKLAKALTAAAGNAGESLYVEDVFSTYLYTGTGATQTITNGIDLDGEGGLVWIKSRDLARGNNLYDSERTGSAYQVLSTDTTSAQYDVTRLSSLNTNGFSLVNSTAVNASGESYASWTFRKAEKFFDVVTYTGTGSNQAVSHNLGSTPAVIIVKRTDASGFGWFVWHKDFSTYQYIALHLTDALKTNSSFPLFVTQNDSSFTVGTNGGTNASGGTYVAYLFASDAGGFGDDGSESIIKCGSVTTTSGGYFSVDLGFEPQWVLIKTSSEAGSWYLTDNLRGYVTYGTSGTKYLLPNSSGAEGGISNWGINSTGFEGSYGGASGINLIYIAIRRPMKTPESGTEVFAIDTSNSTGNAPPQYYSGFPVDFAFHRNNKQLTDDPQTRTRLTATGFYTNRTDAEWALGSAYFAYNDGYGTSTTVDTNDISWMFKRATGFFDVACHTSDGVTESYPHNLGVIPELKIIKNRGDGTVNWVVGGSVLGAPTNRGYYLYLNTNSAMDTNDTFFDQNDTASVYGVRSNNSSAGGINNNSYVVYLFATLAGVSKVGSYTGDGNASQNIDCGFASGARFVLIKSTNAVGSWFVFDTARGIVAGNDSRLELNATSAEVTSADVIDPYSAGFAVTNNSIAINVLGREYIFLAIA